MKNQVRQWANHIKSKSWVWDDVYSVGGLNHLKTLLGEIIPSQSINIYGYHFIFNNQSNSNLGQDGYDNYQAPMSESGKPLFQRRMWVNGLLEYYRNGPEVYDQIRCIEKIQSVRSIGDSVFVTIGRDFSKLEGSPVLKELRTLVYTNELYRKPELVGKVSEVPRSLVGSYKFKLSANDVMRYSSLSYNLHKIHYDLQYCRLEKLANVIASGPFLALLMLHYFQSLFPRTNIKSFKYRNSEPCYVDEELELAVIKAGENYNVSIMKDGRILCGGNLLVQF